MDNISTLMNNDVRNVLNDVNMLLSSETSIMETELQSRHQYMKTGDPVFLSEGCSDIVDKIEESADVFSNTTSEFQKTISKEISAISSGICNTAKKNAQFVDKLDDFNFVVSGYKFRTLTTKRINLSEIESVLKDYNKKIKLDISDLEQSNLTFNVANQLFRDSIELIGSLTNEVYELDSALTEFKKVSDLSGAALDDYVDKLSTLGSEVARTASEMVESATEFRKNGFNDEDAAQLGQIASMYQNVSDEAISAGDSASFIIAQMTAFGIEAENAEHIIDAVDLLAA